MREETLRQSALLIKAFHERFLRERPPGLMPSAKPEKNQRPESVQDAAKRAIARDRVAYPTSGITTSYQRAGLSPDVGKKRVDEMVKLGYLEGPVGLPCPGKSYRTKKCYVVTQKGCEALGVNWDKARLRGKGSLESKLATRMVALHLAGNGALVDYEYTLTNNGVSKASDVAVHEKDGSYTAYEYENGDANLENIRKNAQVGFAKTIVVCRTKKAKEMAESLAKQELEPSLLESEEFKTLKEFA